MKKWIGFWTLALPGIFFAVLPASAGSPELPDHSLVRQAERERMPRVRYALAHGARVELTPDGKSFYLVWFPEGTDPANPPPVLATMHGHGGWAFDDFYVWHRFLKERGYGFLAIQWWLGENEETSGYLKPSEIYRDIDVAFRELGVRPGTAMLHGFSRGAANIYPVAAMDRSEGEGYFALFVANAGRANSDYPPVREVEQGRFGEKPLAGSRWVTYAGAKDTNPDRDGIAGMRAAGEWIRRYGGTLELAIEDPKGDHGGFHRNPSNTDAALDVFDRVRPST